MKIFGSQRFYNTLYNKTVNLLSDIIGKNLLISIYKSRSDFKMILILRISWYHRNIDHKYVNMWLILVNTARVEAFNYYFFSGFATFEDAE